MSIQLDYSIIKSFYHISPEGADQPIFELPAADWPHMEPTKQILRDLGGLWKASSMELPTSFAGISVFYLCVMNMLFSAQSNTFLRLPPESLTFQIEKRNNHAHSGFKLTNPIPLSVPREAEQRRAFLEEAWSGFIAETIVPGIEAFAAAGELKPQMIWNQFGAASYSVRRVARKYLPVPEVVDQIDIDIAVLESLSPDLFKQRRNPFLHKPRFIDNPWEPPDGKLIIRSSCCMYDRRENGTKCYNCPRMLPEERERKRSEVLAKAAQAST